jgi:Rieske Fe-S protein
LPGDVIPVPIEEPRQLHFFGTAGARHAGGDLVARQFLAGLLAEGGSEWAELYDPDRKPARRTIGTLVGLNAAAARDMVRDRLRRRPRSAGDLGAGEAAVLGGTGGPVAAYRDEHGVLHAVSATCTHMGCIVHWNDAERSWDCPCHGSRFDPQGQVLQAPATAPLADRRWALNEDDHGQRAQAS